jgi:hypothetical protein
MPAALSSLARTYWRIDGSCTRCRLTVKNPLQMSSGFQYNIPLASEAFPCAESGDVSLNAAGNYAALGFAGVPRGGKYKSPATTSQPINYSVFELAKNPDLQVTATVSTVTTSMNAQIVAVLLKPGAGSGPFRHVPFKLTINRSSLIGELTGVPFRQLLTDTRDGLVSAVVTTSNGVDPATDAQPGNAQSCEIKGMFVPAGPSPWMAGLIQSIDQGLITTLAIRAS